MKQLNVQLALPAGMCVTALMLTSIAIAQEAEQSPESKTVKTVKIIESDRLGKADVQFYEGAAADSFLKANDIRLDVENTQEAKNLHVFTSQEVIEIDGDETETVKIEHDDAGNTLIVKTLGSGKTHSLPEVHAFKANDDEIQELCVFMAQADDFEDEIEVIIQGLSHEAEGEERVFAKAYSYAYKDSDAGVSLKQGEESGVFSYTLDVDAPTSVSIKVLDSKGNIVHKEKAKVKNHTSNALDLSALSNGSYEVLFETEMKVRKARVVKR